MRYAKGVKGGGQLGMLRVCRGPMWYAKGVKEGGQ